MTTGLVVLAQADGGWQCLCPDARRRDQFRGHLCPAGHGFRHHLQGDLGDQLRPRRPHRARSLPRRRLRHGSRLPGAISHGPPRVGAVDCQCPHRFRGRSVVRCPDRAGLPPADGGRGTVRGRHRDPWDRHRGEDHHQRLHRDPAPPGRRPLGTQCHRPGMGHHRLVRGHPDRRDHPLVGRYRAVSSDPDREWRCGQPPSTRRRRGPRA